MLITAWVAARNTNLNFHFHSGCFVVFSMLHNYVCVYVILLPYRPYFCQLHD